MRIAFITAGAAGMYCGSCMHDNTLASALIKQGHDALLIPTYTPIRTDEEDITYSKVFFGGINVYLQQKSWLFRHTPWFLDRLLNFRWMLRWVSRFAVRTQAHDLGDLTISMLQGKEGNQAKELDKLIAFLRDEHKPEVLLLTNVLLSGIVPEIKKQLNIPVLGILQGDDIFLEALPDTYRKQAIELIGKNCQQIDGYFTTSAYYADFMSRYLSLPRERMHVVFPGLNLKGHGSERPALAETPLVIGYFARICKEKGFHNLVDAYIELRKLPNCPPTKLKASGWLGENHRSFFEEQIQKLRQAGLENEFEHVESPDHASKIRFFQSIDLLSVPTSYREPKGLYILEALANGVPVVQPRHGSFPELIESTQGGILVDSDNAKALANGLLQMLSDRDFRQRCSKLGKEAIFRDFTAEAMARETAKVLEQYLLPKNELRSPISEQLAVR